MGLILGVLLIGEPENALAQNYDPFEWDKNASDGETVLNRKRPALDPLGIRVGAFRIYPSLEVGGRYEDNVFRSPSNEKSDVAATFAPKMRLQSDFSNHSVQLTAEAKVYRYGRHSSEDRAEFSFGAKGRLDIDRDSHINASASLARRYENRSSPDQGGTQKPVYFDIASAALSGERTFGRIKFGVETRLDRLDYADALLRGSGVRVNNDDRDRTIGALGVEGAYAFTPGNSVYARLEGNVRDYHDAVDDAGIDRDSTGAELRLGVKMDFGGITYSDVYIGYRAQRYEDNGLARLNDDSIDALIFGANAHSNITGLTTLHAGVERSVFESTLVGSPGGQAVRGRVGAEHELLRNLLLTTSLSGRWFEFEGIKRNDVGVLFQFGATYLMNRHARLEATVEHERNRSSGPQQGISSDSNRIMLRLTANP